MGGIAIWCMHYIGNSAIDIADGEYQLQITYSSGFTGLSFCLPIIVLVAAFVAIGTNDKVSWWRVAVGGTLAGVAICGMHYLGNKSINNYVLIYKTSNVVGAALIAVAASNISLSAFFVFRGAWTHTWWKRGISAVVLASAVSGMHWCASTGTTYKLVALAGTNNQLSRRGTVIIVTCLVSCYHQRVPFRGFSSCLADLGAIVGWSMSRHGRFCCVHGSYHEAICQQGTADCSGSSSL